MADKSKGGRPPKYTEEQVRLSIELAEARGLEPSADAVKSIMCSNFEVSSGINAQSLAGEIRRILVAREAEEARVLMEKLPTAAKYAAATIGTQVQQSLVEFMAREFDGLRKEARQRELEREEDLRIAHARMADLESDLAESNGLREAAEDEAESLRAQAEANAAVIGEMKRQISEQGSLEDLLTKLVAQMNTRASESAPRPAA